MQRTPASTAGESREQIIARLASITTMRPGTLTEEYRQGAPGKDGKPVRLGPYYKLQVWRDGANRTSRVPADEVDHLREDIDNYHTFGQLCARLAQLNIEHTLALRAANTHGAGADERKKTRVHPRQTARRQRPHP